MTNNPRWIADLEKLVLFERQPDNTYRAAYRMTPITQYAADHPGEPPIVSG